MNNRTNVLELAESLKQWSILTLLAHFGPPEKCAEVLEMTFRSAAKAGDDEAAKILYHLLVRNYEDMAVVCKMRQETESRRQLSEKESAPLYNTINRLIFSKTEELYQQNAGFMTRENGDYAQLRDWTPPEEATLLETKKEMLRRMASRWHYSSDEKESDACFRFLFAAYRFASHHKEEKMITELLHESTPDYFPATRLARSIVLLPPKSTWASALNAKLKNFMVILGKTWVRNSSLKTVGNAFATLLPVLEVLNETKTGSDQVFVLFKKTAHDLADFNKKVLELMDILQPRKALERIPGEISYSFPDMEIGKAEILIEVDPDALYGLNGKIQEKGHELFELARDRVASWKSTHSSYEVKLTLNILGSKFSKEPSFSRSQTFGRD